MELRYLLSLTSVQLRALLSEEIRYLTSEQFDARVELRAIVTRVRKSGFAFEVEVREGLFGEVDEGEYVERPLRSVVLELAEAV